MEVGSDNVYIEPHQLENLNPSFSAMESVDVGELANDLGIDTDERDGDNGKG